MAINPTIYLAESNNGADKIFYIYKHDNEGISEPIKKFRVFGCIKKCVDFIKNDVRKIKFEEAFNLTYFLLFYDDGLVMNNVHRSGEEATSFSVEKGDVDFANVKVSYFVRRRSKKSFERTHKYFVEIRDGECYFKESYLKNLRDKLLKFMLSEDMF